jgi:hypothetical protein
MSGDVIFLLGPSGAGKSTLGRWLAEDLGLLHLEMDRWPEGNGIDLEGLRGEWTLLCRRQAAPLVEAARRRAAFAGRSGVVLSFPSGVVLGRAVLEAAERAGVCPLVLYGAREECLAAFLERERATGRLFTTDHWVRFNRRPHGTYGGRRLARYRVGVFAGGVHRPRADLVAEVRRRASGL